MYWVDHEVCQRTSRCLYRELPEVLPVLPLLPPERWENWEHCSQSWHPQTWSAPRPLLSSLTPLGLVPVCRPPDSAGTITLFPSFLYIFGVVALSLLSQDIALIHRKRIDICFVDKEIKLSKIMHRFTFMLFAVFCPWNAVFVRDFFLYKGLLVSLAFISRLLEPNLQLAFLNKQMVVLDLCLI